MSWICKTCNEINDNIHVVCWKCKLEGEATLKEERKKTQQASETSKHISPPKLPTRASLPCSTTAEIPNKKTIESKGIVCGEAILGNNVLRDFGATITNIVGGRSGVYESKLQEGRQIALTEMMEEAEKAGANAVIGVKIDYETIYTSMLMICASGTAVVIEE